MSQPPLVLASASPRRRQLLAQLGLSFEQAPADINEDMHAAETAEIYVRRLSEAKARAVVTSYPDHFIIAADTVVVLDGQVLGKPQTLEENRHFIGRLAGRVHHVYTGYALLWRERASVTVLTSQVRLRHLDEAEISWYVASQEGMDKAGGYGIQGYGSALVDWLEGCYFNVVGLSLAHLCKEAKGLGVDLV